MTALCKENIKWSEEKFTLTTFRECQIPLPAIILITGGYYGRDDTETFSSDDILILHEWRTQERVLARKQKISISIPLEFEHMIELVAEPSRPEYLLSEIVRNFQPPLKARFKGGANVSFNIKNVLANTDDFGPFTLISSHLVDYVTVSAVAEGTVNQDELFHLPPHRQVRFKVAQTMLGIPIEQHGGLRNLPHHMVMEHTLGILDYAELLDTMDEYDYIQEIPQGRWKRSKKNRQPQLHINVPDNVDNDQDVYEELEPSSPPTTVTRVTPCSRRVVHVKSTRTPRLPIDQTYYSPRDIHVESTPLSPPVAPKTKRRPIAPISPMHPSTLPRAPFLAGAVQTGLELVHSSPGLSPTSLRQSAGLFHIRSGQSARSHGLSAGLCPTSPGRSPRLSPISTGQSAGLSSGLSPSSPRRFAGLSPTSPGLSARLSPISPELSAGLSSGRSPKSPQLSARRYGLSAGMSPTSPGPSAGLSPTSPGLSARLSPTSPGPSAGLSPTSPGLSSAGSPKSPTMTGVVPWMKKNQGRAAPDEQFSFSPLRAPVPGPPVLPRTATIKKTGQENNGKDSAPSGFKKLSDVPENIMGLTIDQVCNCLKLLNLEQFTDKFRNDMMDGRLLKTCTEDILKEQYDMSLLTARKLCMFANKGWRPKD